MSRLKKNVRAIQSNSASLFSRWGRFLYLVCALEINIQFLRLRPGVEWHSDTSAAAVAALRTQNWQWEIHPFWQHWHAHAPICPVIGAARNRWPVYPFMDGTWRSAWIGRRKIGAIATWLQNAKRYGFFHRHLGLFYRRSSRLLLLLRAADGLHRLPSIVITSIENKQHGKQGN